MSERKVDDMRVRRRTPLLAALVAGGFVLAACGGDDDDSSATTAPAATDASPTSAGAASGDVSDADKEAVVTSYADLVLASYDASIASATTLNEAIKAFVADPSEANLQAAKDQWLTARDDYGPTEAFRFYDGPIDNPDTGPEGRINAWPLDEAYLDYVEGDPQAGIINDPATYPEITTDVLVETNEQGGETNISTGWHAVEFLLWGQDASVDGPGARPVTDYTTAPNAERRGTYLQLLGDLLAADLTEVRDQWDPDTGGNYRATFVADPDAALNSIFRGIGALTAGELAGERMTVAYETKDQEDEHSCFSDNTNADVAGNATGVQRVYLGEFPGFSGASLSSLVAKVAPDVDARLRSGLDETVALTTSFPSPFDQMIQGDDGAPGRAALLSAIEALEQQGDTIAEAAQALGISVDLEV